MIETYKKYEVFDKSKQDYKTVKIFTARHASDRFTERAVPGSEEKIKSVIGKAIDKIVNYYPHEPGDYIIKSPSAGVKIPFEVNIENNEFRINIPTILAYNMKARDENVIPNITFEEVQYILHKEILVD